MRSVRAEHYFPRCKITATLNGLRLALARQRARRGTLRRLRRVLYPRMYRPSTYWWPLRPSTARQTRVIANN